jgi:hypothetical protein
MSIIMSFAKWLDAIGVFLAFIGAVLLSIDAFGKEKIFDFLQPRFGVFRKNLLNISFFSGIIVSFCALPFIDHWKTSVIKRIVPVMYKENILSIVSSTIVILVILLFLTGGGGISNFKRIGLFAKNAWLTSYRIITNFKRNVVIRQINKKNRNIFFRNIQRNVNLHSLAIAYIYVITLAFFIFYLVTKQPFYWVYSIIIGFTFVIVFLLMVIGFAIVRCVLFALQFLIREDADHTIQRLKLAGFGLIAFGFILQIFGIMLW